MPEYPALAIQAPNVVGNFIGGMQQGQEMQGAQVRNEMLMQEQQQRQQAMQRDEQFRNLLAQSVGPMAANAAGPMGDAQNYLMQGTQNTFAPPPETMNQLMQLDPERAMQMQQAFQQQQQQQQAEMRERAGVSVRAAQFVLKSKDPKLTLELGFPEMVEQLRGQGIELDDLDDDAVLEMANNVVAQLGPIAGMGPTTGESPFAKINPADYTAESVKAFEASANFGDLVAREKPGDDPNDKTFTREGSLRKEFDNRVEGFNTVRSAYKNVETAEPNDSGDTQLVLNFMRVISPGVRVQPGERIEDAASVPGVPQKVIGIWNKLLSDGKLSDTQRKEIRSQAKRTFESQEQLAKKERTRYIKLAKDAGLDPSRVVGDDDTPAPGGGSGGGSVDLSTLSDDDLLKALNGG